jgi:hypothetical protein
MKNTTLQNQLYAQVKEEINDQNLIVEVEPYGITFDPMHIQLSPSMRASFHFFYQRSNIGINDTSDHTLVFIEYNDKVYELTAYEISEGYPYKGSWWKKLNAINDLMFKYSLELHQNNPSPWS